MKKYVKTQEKLKTQGKNSKLKVNTQKVSTFRIPGCRKRVLKKPDLIAFFVNFCILLTQFFLPCVVGEEALGRNGGGGCPGFDSSELSRASC